MRHLLLPAVFLFFIACQTTSEDVVNSVENATEIVTETVALQPDSVLRHAVYFAYNDDTTPEQIEVIETAFANLPSQIEEIKGFEKGLNSSPEGLNKGLTHAYLLTFHSDAARDAYLPHPAHKAFGEIAGPHIKDLLVIDYWTKG